ncbi:hypothetical protein HMF7854_06385 [Sphingomonas ginkgonis]|uniref:Uncharacterized protein n=1 Tax=Sphingomonas ginkgonis TaxID=2315330 RepID=A0A3R9WND6_9SPHN|nr:hypothetical protein [Sphingomonas ginkgonis]RST30500.1 hypothetical protein HMF7854_06385 [Sphingomonas ginkgonis]
MTSFTSDQWVIIALVFLLGLVVGGFLFAGGGRKWKHRYRTEVERREALETDHQKRVAEFDAREKEWREQDSLRGAAMRDRGVTDADLRARDSDLRARDRDVRADDRARGDYDHDGVPDRDERR